MRNHHRNGHDSLDTKGNRLFATQQVLVTVLRVVRLSGIRASFFMTLPARRSCRQDWQPYGQPDGRTGIRSMSTRAKLELYWLQLVSWLQPVEQSERLRSVLRCRVAVG
jgi:hypothetical protein